MAVVQRSWSPVLAVVLALYLLLTSVLSVKHENFKTCAQSGFCTRNRAYADEATKLGSSWHSPYILDAPTLSLDDGELTGTILKTIDVSTGEKVKLPLKIAFLKSGAARVTVDEEKRQKGDIELRHDSKARKERYNEVEKWTIVGGLEKSKGAAVKAVEGEVGLTRVLWGEGGKFEAIIRHEPFGLEFIRDGQTHVKFNERGFMNMEHWRKKVEKPVIETTAGDEQEVIQSEPEAPVINDDTWWDESFGGNTDSKPRGPESVAMDISFPGYEHVFGIPEHTGPLSLRETRGTSGEEGKFTEPYRLYNLDVFEYILDSPMALYGAIPYMQAHRKDSSVGVFWMNAAETWIDIEKSKSAVNAMSLGLAGSVDTRTHWFSESGLIDVFVLLGPKPEDNSKAFAELTGTTAMPQMFAIAYHQCRWNYVSDEDVKDVDRKFDRAHIPYDVIWLDLEYTDDRKYFTWEPLSFADPIGMQKQLDEHQRKLVTLIDPHLKKRDGYKVYDELVSKDLAVKNKQKEIYEGWCWPGASHWVDCFNPAASKWWKGLFKYDKFVGSQANTFIWNDMNEPSVFNGPETTMPKDNLHYEGWEHRDVHNVNGMTFHNATFQGLIERDGAKKAVDRKRPFVLTRAFYAGSQRSSALWTGDNQADWGHLAGSLSMAMQLGTSGFPFAGADIGGFFGNPSKELLTRWYQTGIWYPFMRAHAHLDTRRREPYLLGEPYTGIITQALRLRYALLPAWYTAFRAASVSGGPIIRPNWYVHPGDAAGFAIDDQIYLGATGLLAKPVTSEGGESVHVYLADERTYYDYFDYTVYAGSAGRTHTVAAPLDKIPLLMRAGHIFPRRDRPRRSSSLMKWDPFTLVIVLDAKTDTAQGDLYLDDGESYAFTEGAYTHRSFSFSRAATDASSSSSSAYILTSADLVPEADAKTKQHAAYVQSIASLHVEKVVIVGAPAAWKGKTSVLLSEEASSSHGGKKTSDEGTRSASFEFVAGSTAKNTAAWAVVKNPGLQIAKGWKITF